MIFQASNLATANPLDALTSFVTLMIALSVAAERMTETIKQWLSPYLAKKTAAGAAGTVQLYAVLSGIVVTALSGQNPINIPDFAPFDWRKYQDWLCWVLTGILVSGGSAFWNHILDILKATKVQKEQAVNATLTAAGAARIPG